MRRFVIGSLALFVVFSAMPMHAQHYSASYVAGQTNQSCDNIGEPLDKPGTQVCTSEGCPPVQSCRIVGANSAGPATEDKNVDVVSPFGVMLSESQGFSAVVDSGIDGIGTLPSGCSSCGAGASIPQSSQMLRFWWPRYWRSTWTHDGSLGRGMYSGFDYYVLKYSSSILLRDPNNGLTATFVDSGGSYIPTAGTDYGATITEATGTHITIRQPGGMKLRFEITAWEQNGAAYRCRLEYVEDIAGRRVTFSYVVAATNATANVMKWTEAVDPYNKTTTFTYTVWNGLNVINRVTFPDSHTIDYSYTTDNERFAHKVEYGTSGTPSGIESKWYATTSVQMNEALLPTDHYFWTIGLSDSAFGRVRSFKRFDDEFVYARSVTEDAGIVTVTTWKKGVVREINRAMGQQLISSRKQKLDGTWEADIEYDANNFKPPVGYTEPADGDVPARTTSVVRDPASQMVTERTYPDETTEEYEYNAFNQMTSFVDRNGNEQAWTYNAAGNMLTHTVAVGTAIEATETWTYNAREQIESYEDFNGNVTEYEYYDEMADTPFELHKIVLPAGIGQPAGEIVFTYDDFGRIASVTDPGGRTSSFEYDDAGRHITTTYADTSTEETVYGTGNNSARVSKIIDRNGNETRFTYDATGRVETIKGMEGDTETILTTTTNAYDEETGLLTSVNVNGDVTEYEYDYQNRIVETTVYPRTGESLTTESVYNRYRLEEIIDYYGRATSYTYDELNRLLSTTFELRPGGDTITTSIEYDDEGNVEATIDGNGNRTEYAYDDRNRRVSTTYAVGSDVEASTSVEYDDNSNVTKRIDERSHEWLTTYTSRNRILTSEDPEGGETAYTYTEDTLVATVTNANGHTTTNIYEACCARLAEREDADENSIFFEYDFNGNVTQTTDESGRVVKYEYDGLNRETKQQVDPFGLNLTTTTTYDPTPSAIGQSSTTINPAGQEVTAHVDGLGRTSFIEGGTAGISYDYDDVIAIGGDAGLVKTTVHVDPSNLDLTSATLTDGAGRTIKRLDGFNNANVFTYDDNSNVLTSTDRDGKLTTNTYDERDRLVTSEGDSGGIESLTQFEYDDTNNLTQVTDAQIKVTVYTYDDANRRLTTTYAHGTADARAWTTTYTPLGQVETLTKPNGIDIEYAYNDVEQLSSRTYNDGMVVLGTDTFTYHPNRLLATAHGGLYNTDLDRSNINNDYDDANRLVEERIDIGDGDKTVAYNYTADSLVSQISYPGGTIQDRTFNSHRLLNEIKLGSTTQASHSYDTADRRDTRAYVNGTATTWAYDANSRITNLNHATTAMMPVTFQEWDYRYSDAGNALVQDDITPMLTVHGEAYQYDGLHRLIDFKRGSVTGNTVPTPTYYQDWTLTKVGDWSEWDVNGATETRTHNNIHALTNRSMVANNQTYDQNFNQTDDGSQFKFEYDANDKLAIVRDRGTNNVIAEYRYDALGRRVEKDIDGDVTRYYHSGQQIIEERDDMDSVVATYTYGDYIDEPLTMDRDGERYYFHQNRLYSTYVLTDDNGDVVERYAYTAYGVVTTYDNAYANPQSTSRVHNPHTFTGQILDQESLLMHFRYRVYDPVEGRFKQLDPIGLVGGLNLYSAAFIPNRLDPFGLQAVEEEPTELIPATGKIVEGASGSVRAMDGRTVDVMAGQDVVLQGRRGGKILVDPNTGKPLEQHGFVHFKMTSSNCDDCHWLQFYKNYAKDKDGRQTAGVAIVAEEVLVNNGAWALDADLPGEKPKPDQIYYDTMQDAPIIRTKNEISMFDRPSDRGAWKEGNVEQGAYFKTYAVCDGNILWEMSWTYVCRIKGAEINCGVENLTGRAATNLDPQLRTRNWSQGFRFDRIPNTNNVQVGNEVTVSNPFFGK